jgi:type I restriction-modification system DNA methylase subunit
VTPENRWISLLLMSPIPVPGDQLGRALVGFAEDNGWRPSDQILAYPGTEEFARGHILVEHGLSHTAVLSFLKWDITFEDLSRDEKNRILSISYNNLVDWHCFPNARGQLVVFNRAHKGSERVIDLKRNPDAWRVEAFDQIVGRKPNANFPALDEALIQTVSRWKRILASEFRLGNNTGPIAELFNAIFFARAMEDSRQSTLPGRGLLLDLLEEPTERTIGETLKHAIRQLSPQPGVLPVDLFDEAALAVFDTLDQSTKGEIFSDFYQNKFAPYHYDFSVISKHALSRIYERYISLLKEREPQQMTLFGSEIEEVPNRTLGGFYTPQFIARFFARFLEANHSASRFRRLRTIDPSCGSGMFLRTLLEMQCDTNREIDVSVTTMQAFANIRGVDVEPNACKAARLSLYLLHLILVGKFPSSIAIDCFDAIGHFANHPELFETFDTVIANPPFVKWEQIPNSWQETVVSYLGELRRGRTDLYLAFLKAGLDLVVPGGFLLYVLPNSFLIANNAEGLRKAISEQCWIHVLADLSDIEVFGVANAYPILLIAQKKGPDIGQPRAMIARCSGFVGHALQDVISGIEKKNPYYTIYATEQTGFDKDSWKISTPAESRLLARFSTFPRLSDFLEIRQGIITGKDKIFIRKKTEVPETEREVYVDFLSDREIEKYRVPATTSKLVFYPFDGERQLDASEIQDRYPETWRYLITHESILRDRKSLARTGYDRWWSPLWTRSPRALLRPKIVTPHLILFPRFALDERGQYAVTHSPYLFPANSTPGEEFRVLYFLLAILNSTAAHWQMIQHSGKYSRGYAVLEPATLKKVRVPSPASVDPRRMRTVERLVDQLVHPTGEPEDPMVAQLDYIIAELYGVDLGEVSEVVLEHSDDGNTN